MNNMSVFNNHAIQALINSPALMQNAREILAGFAAPGVTLGNPSPFPAVNFILPSQDLVSTQGVLGGVSLAAFTHLPSDAEKLRLAVGEQCPPTPRISSEVADLSDEDDMNDINENDDMDEEDKDDEDFDDDLGGDEKGLEDELLQATRMDQPNAQSRIEVVQGPAKHQVKEFNILPNNVIHVKYTPKNSDYILIRLICDKKMRKREKVIFLSAVSPKHAVNQEGEIVLQNLKISKEMLQGRTKGFKFCLAYTLVENGKEVETIKSNTFYIWSNVNQPGFPRKQREQYLAQRIRNNKNKRKNT